MADYKGNCKVTVAEKEYELEDNDNIYIPKNTHQVENTGIENLSLLKFSLVWIMKEDIVRIGDDYGRI